MKLFDHLNNISIDKKPLDINDDSQFGSYVPFMINRFVSMTDIYIPIVNEINMVKDIPKEIHQRYYRMSLPKRKNYFTYIKKLKEVDSETKDCIQEYYECSKKETEEYLKVLSDDQIKKIVRVFKSGR